jgi:acyl carrier protein
MADVRTAIREEIGTVLKEAGKPAPVIDDSTSLMRGALGLDSMDFAVLVVRLEQRLGRDPFNSTTLEKFPTTVGELAALYEQSVPATGALK